MTYNIKNANGMDDVCDSQRIADVINHIHPEVVALQELDLSLIHIYTGRIFGIRENIRSINPFILK